MSGYLGTDFETLPKSPDDWPPDFHPRWLNFTGDQNDALIAQEFAAEEVEGVWHDGGIVGVKYKRLRPAPPYIIGYLYELLIDTALYNSSAYPDGITFGNLINAYSFDEIIRESIDLTLHDNNDPNRPRRIKLSPSEYCPSRFMRKHHPACTDGDCYWTWESRTCYIRPMLPFPSVQDCTTKMFFAVCREGDWRPGNYLVLLRATAL